MRLDYLMSMASAFAGAVDIMNTSWKDRIYKEWEASKNYPRKKKKACRKSLRLEWDVFSYDPFAIEQKYEKPPWT